MYKLNNLKAAQTAYEAALATGGYTAEESAEDLPHAVPDRRATNQAECQGH